MKDTHKHSFEEEFRKAFEEAEATPESTVWAELDAHLANQEVAGYKRKLYYFKITAAAAVILLFGFLGGWLAMNENPFSIKKIAEVNHPASSNTAQNEIPQANSDKALEAPAQVKQETTIASANKALSAEKMIAAENESIDQPIANSNSSLPDAEDNATRAKDNTVKENTNTPLAALPDKRVQQGKQKLSGDKSIIANNSLPQENNVLLNGKGKMPVTSQHSIARNPANTFSGLSDKPAIDQPIKENPELQQKDRVAFGTANTINRLNNKVYINSLPLIMEAPTIKPQMNNSFLAVVEEAEEKQTNSASKWAMNVAFTPNQFSPNMQVDQKAVNSPYMKYSYANKSFASPNNLSPGLANATTSPVGNDLENAQTSGISYNIGVNVSYALSDRLSVQSGVQYMRNNSQIVTDNYLEDFNSRDRYPAFLSLVSNNNSGAAMALADSPVLQNTNFNNIAKTNAYSGVTEVAVYNTYQYLSIPLRVHYKLIDRKISTSIGAGIAADVFLNNTIGNEAANISSTNLDSQASIYKSIGMSGIFSTKLDYEFSSRYSVFLEPSYRTAITSFTKSYLVKSLPSAFGIGTGFQYRF